MKLSFSCVRIVKILGARRRVGFLAEAIVSVIQGGWEDGNSFVRQQRDNEIKIMALEGQKQKAAEEFLLARGGAIRTKRERGDNNKDSALMRGRILKAGAENEIGLKGS